MKLEFVVLCLVVSAVAASIRLAGEWTPIKDLKDPHVVEIAEFAVKDYNKRINPLHPLKLKSIEKGESQVVDRTNYRFLLVVEEDAADKKYDALVWEKPDNSKRLLSFTAHH